MNPNADNSESPLIIDNKHQYLQLASAYTMGSHNQLPHLHHHSPPTLQPHDSSSARYLWDPTAVTASNFHHPSAHG